jgi:hypothetical protein
MQQNGRKEGPHIGLVADNPGKMERIFRELLNQPIELVFKNANAERFLNNAEAYQQFVDRLRLKMNDSKFDGLIISAGDFSERLIQKLQNSFPELKIVDVGDTNPEKLNQQENAISALILRAFQVEAMNGGDDSKTEQHPYVSLEELQTNTVHFNGRLRLAGSRDDFFCDQKNLEKSLNKGNSFLVWPLENQDLVILQFRPVTVSEVLPLEASGLAVMSSVYIFDAVIEYCEGTRVGEFGQKENKVSMYFSGKRDVQVYVSKVVK